MRKIILAIGISLLSLNSLATTKLQNLGATLSKVNYNSGKIKNKSLPIINYAGQDISRSFQISKTNLVG